MISKWAARLTFTATLLSSAATAQVEISVMDDFEVATRLANSGNHEIAMEMFEQCAAADDARCSFSLGTYYYFGDGGVEIDFEEAHRYFKQSADMGFGPSEYFLALSYRDGSGVEADIDIALRYLNSAARRCVQQAQTDMAEYYEGRGNADSTKMAAAWYAVAADNGSDLARSSLTRILAGGDDDFEADVASIREEVEASLQCQEW